MPDSKYIENPDDIRLNENRELQQILGNPPGWLLHWGITFIFVGVMVFMALGWLVKYPDVIPSRIILTTEEPPIRVYAETFGKLKEFRVNDQEEVDAGAIIAVLDNPANLEDINTLDSFLTNIRNDLSELTVITKEIPRNLKLGSLQSVYADFSKSYDRHVFFLKKNRAPDKVRNLRAQIRKLQGLGESLERQLSTVQKVISLSKKEMDRNKELRKIGGVTETQIEAAEEAYLLNLRQEENLRNEMINNNLQIERTRMQIIEIKESYKDGRSSGLLTIEEDIQKMQSQVDNWKKTFLIQAPISGKVSLTKFRSTQQYISQNEELLTIVPKDMGKVIAKGMLSFVGSGKVTSDMRANIRLDGYPYQEFGSIQCEVKSISLVPQEDGFMIELIVPQPLQTTYDKTIPFQQEMQGTANIITEDRRILERIFDRILSIIFNE